MIYLSFPKRLHSTYFEKLVEEELTVLFNTHVENGRYENPDHAKEFDLLCDCDGLAIFPEEKDQFNAEQKWEVRIAVALHKDIYLVTDDFRVLKAYVKGFKEVEPRRMEQGTDTGSPKPD